MDYSLLVGVNKEKNELVFGIIDYLRQYTWDKQLETWVKTSLVPKNVLPTVISPRIIRKGLESSWASTSSQFQILGALTILLSHTNLLVIAITSW
jgi:hypothetical protein